jgi:Major Facilitator Superfamily
MCRDLGLDFRHVRERPVPARLQFARDQPIGWIGSIVLPEGAVGSVARRFKVAAEGLTHLIPPLARLLLGGCGGGDRLGCAAVRCGRGVDPQNGDAMSSAAAALPGRAFGAGSGTDAGMDPRKLVGFIAMVFGMFMAILDTQIVSASLTDIQAGLAASNDEISWVQTAYLVAEVIAIPLSGFLSRALGTRILFAASAAGFTVASFMCGTTSSINEMIAWRALQGFIGGGMIPTVFAFTLTTTDIPGRSMVEYAPVATERIQTTELHAGTLHPFSCNKVRSMSSEPTRTLPPAA